MTNQSCDCHFFAGIFLINFKTSIEKAWHNDPGKRMLEKDGEFRCKSDMSN